MNIIPFPNDKERKRQESQRHDENIMESAFDKLIDAFIELSALNDDPLGRLTASKLSVYIQLYLNRGH